MASDSWLGRLARGLVASVIVVALLAPIIICSYLTQLKTRVIVVAVSTAVGVIAFAVAIPMRAVELIVAGTAYVYLLRLHDPLMNFDRYATLLAVFVSTSNANLN